MSLEGGREGREGGDGRVGEGMGGEGRGGEGEGREGTDDYYTYGTKIFK